MESQQPSKRSSALSRVAKYYQFDDFVSWIVRIYQGGPETIA